jgi:hypothetical protein
MELSLNEFRKLLNEGERARKDSERLRDIQQSRLWQSKMAKEIGEGSERHCAIMGCVLVDESLREFLAAHLTNDAVASALLDGGALGLYSNRVRFARQLGLAGRHTLSDMDLIGEIRNRFAHKAFIADETGALTDVSFNDKYVQERCAKLWWPKQYLEYAELAGKWRTHFMLSVVRISEELRAARFGKSNDLAK